MHENLDIFAVELTEEDMAAIDSLDQGEAGRLERQLPAEHRRPSAPAVRVPE